MTYRARSRRYRVNYPPPPSERLERSLCEEGRSSSSSCPSRASPRNYSVKRYRGLRVKPRTAVVRVVASLARGTNRSISLSLSLSPFLTHSLTLALSFSLSVSIAFPLSHRAATYDSLGTRGRAGGTVRTRVEVCSLARNASSGSLGSNRIKVKRISNAKQTGFDRSPGRVTRRRAWAHRSPRRRGSSIAIPLAILYYRSLRGRAGVGEYNRTVFPVRPQFGRRRGRGESVAPYGTLSRANIRVFSLRARRKKKRKKSRSTVKQVANRGMALVLL